MKSHGIKPYYFKCKNSSWKIHKFKLHDNQPIEGIKRHLDNQANNPL